MPLKLVDEMIDVAILSAKPAWRHGISIARKLQAGDFTVGHARSNVH